MPIYRRPDEDEEEIMSQEDVSAAETSTELSDTEKTWAKRYGDLRRQYQRMQSTLSDMEKRLQSNTYLTVPQANDEAAIDQWITEHPDVAAIVMGLADRRAAALTEGIQTRLQSIDEKEAKLAKDTAFTKLNALHPDFFTTIRHEESFHEWLATKSKSMQDAIYGDANDWQAASDVIDLYKIQNGGDSKKSSSRTDKQKEDAREVRGRSNRPNSPETGRRMRFSESQVERMSGREYEQFEEAINEAIRNGEFEYDLTGGAR